MKEVLLQRPHHPSEEHIHPERYIKPRRHLSSAPQSKLTWGRHQQGTWNVALGCAGIMCLCPMLVILLWISITSFEGSVYAALLKLFSIGPREFVAHYAPVPSRAASIGYLCWLVFQGFLHLCLPSKLSTGQLTPAGHLLQYKTNGLLAWSITHGLFLVFSVSGTLDPAIIAKNWEGLLVAVNVYGFLLSSFAYVKAHLAPTHPTDRKFSGSILYDFYMGIELNPRFGLWDFKLFYNGRPGIVAWTLIDLSFTAWQYQLHGYITNSMIVVDVLHFIYVLDFFINEDWYLRTIDICHDHFGFYLGWGSCVWLPSVYTLQTQYLARYPLTLQSWSAFLLFTTGLMGYIIFRGVNHQKNIVRKTNGKCNIWGRKAVVVRAEFKTSDGATHHSLLLCSGWWGICRHANYFGDLMLSYSMCAVCGTRNLLPWTYAIFMTCLLVHRCFRDEERCSHKYGDDWKAYCRIVRWKLIPGVW